MQEIAKMNTTQASKKTGPAAKLIRQLAPANKTKVVEWPRFAPERITEQASATTEVLSEILEQGARTHQIRHWGINE